MSETAPNINQTLCKIRNIKYCLTEDVCDRCGIESPKFSVAQRTAIDVDMSHPILLNIYVSVHYCADCHHYFRAQPPFLRRDGIYSHRVIDKAVRAIVEDGMPFVPH